MILEKILCCECNPGKIFKTNSTYKAHLKSKRHENWVSNTSIKNYKKSSVEYENNIVNYKLRLERLDIDYKKLEMDYKKLYNKINLLKKKNQYYLNNIIILIIILNIKYSYL